MRKRCISIKDCYEGNILAEEITSSQGIILVAKDTIINRYIKNKLAEMDIEYIWIYESTVDAPKNFSKMDLEDIKEEYYLQISEIKLIINELSSGKKLNYTKLLGISNSIYSWNNEFAKVVQCLEELRNTDLYTYTHSINVSFYAMLIAKWLHLSEEDQKNVIQAGFLHDIGKIKICNNILNKKGKLLPEEFNEIKKHTLYGYDLINNIDSLDERVKNAVLMHHERLDGSGYPYGLLREEISLYARIISIADVYDAMVSDRIYKSRTSPFEAFSMFLTSGIRGFDAKIAKTFINNLAIYYVGTRVALNNGEIGEVVFIPPHDITRPILNLRSQYIDLSRDNEKKILCMV